MANTATCRIWLSATDLQQHFVPAQRNLRLSNLRLLLGDGEPDARAGNIDGAQPNQHRNGREHFEIDQCLQPHSAQAPHLSVRSDAGDQGTENEGSNNGLDQAQEDVAKYPQADGEGGRIHPQFAARDHGPKDPGHQRTAPPGRPSQQQQASQPKRQTHICRRVHQERENSGAIKSHPGDCGRMPGYDLSSFYHEVVTAGHYFTVRKRQQNWP
jgi:hypothetical protein